VHVQIHHHGEEPISEKALLAEEFRSCGQPPQLRQRRAGPRAADRIEDGEGAEVGHCPQLPDGRIHARNVRRCPRIAGLEQQDHRGRIGKDALELARRGVVRIAGLDQPLEPAFRRDARSADGGQRDQQGIDEKDGRAQGNDASQDPGGKVVHRFQPIPFFA